MHLANLSNLTGTDLLVIFMILFVLSMPALIALPIILILNRRSKKTPPLPTSTEEPKR